MSRWSVRNPEAMDEIAKLPPSRQNEALRAAVSERGGRWENCPGCGANVLRAPWEDLCPLCGRKLRKLD